MPKEKWRYNRGAFGPPIGGIPPIFKKLDKNRVKNKKNWRFCIKKLAEGSAQEAVVFAKDKKIIVGMKNDRGSPFGSINASGVEKKVALFK